MFEFQPLTLEGAYLIKLPAFADERGIFTKCFQDQPFLANNLNFQLKESYFSISRKDVIRGMHFQIPPHQHAKIVFCPKGSILDVIVDLRKGSSTYGRHHAEILSEQNHLAYYIPEGFAHGFQSLEDGAMTYYLVSSEYSKDHDTGILYNSIGINWDGHSPIISDRDKSFTTFEDFKSPF